MSKCRLCAYRARVCARVEPSCARVEFVSARRWNPCVRVYRACVRSRVEPVSARVEPVYVRVSSLCVRVEPVCARLEPVSARVRSRCVLVEPVCVRVRQPWPSSSEGQGSHPADTSSTPRPMVLRNCMSSIEGASLSSSFTLISRFRAQSRHDMATLFSKSRDRRRHVDFILEISDLSRQTISWYFTFILEIPRFKSTFRH